MMKQWIQSRHGVTAIVISALCLLSLLLLVLLLSNQIPETAPSESVERDTVLTPSSQGLSPTPLDEVKTEELATTGEPSLSLPPDAVEPQTVAEVPTGDLPFLYEIHRDRITSLSPEQQESLLKVHEQFVEFYRQNPAAIYDESGWNRQMGELRERTVNAIGIDAFESLIR